MKPSPKILSRRSRTPLALALAAVSASLAGCSANTATTPAPATPTAAPASAARCDVARDRAAIRAMAGTFRVTFDFQETDALAEGYAPRPAYHTSATEVVEVLESSDRRIVLQHVLMLGSGAKAIPNKHWRQDWTFEDGEVVEFRGKRTWERRPLAEAERACTWTQAVFEVDDAPRYESFGAWSHDAAASTWTSRETWRPLPRREYTKRSDYDVLVATNVHVVTPTGWRHEQANTKLVLDGMRPLVRERGLNTYERIEVPATEVARTYLRATGPFWSEVRAEWQRLIAAHPRFTIDVENGGEPLYERLFPIADELAKGPRPDGGAGAEWRAKMLSALRAYVRPVAAAAATPARVSAR